MKLEEFIKIRNGYIKMHGLKWYLRYIKGFENKDFPLSLESERRLYSIHPKRKH